LPKALIGEVAKIGEYCTKLLSVWDGFPDGRFTAEPSLPTQTGA
jgi:hypothetical protein